MCRQVILDNLDRPGTIPFFLICLQPLQKAYSLVQKNSLHQNKMFIYTFQGAKGKLTRTITTQIDTMKIKLQREKNHMLIIMTIRKIMGEIKKRGKKDNLVVRVHSHC
jgi:hypothetical protein